MAEFVQLCVNVGDGKFTAAAADELYGLAGLKIDAGDQHGRRTSICCEARNCFKARMDWVLSWKMDAASAASAAPAVKTSAKCCGDFAPPLAMTGTETEVEMALVRAMSNPDCVPSRSMLVRRISPAPSSTASFAQPRASRWVESRPPRMRTSQWGFSAWDSTTAGSSDQLATATQPRLVALLDSNLASMARTTA